MTDFADQHERSPHYVSSPEELTMHINRWTAVAVACGAALWVLFGAWVCGAFAAERDRPHELWLLTKPVAISWAAANDEQHIFRIGAFPSHAACVKAKSEMRKVAGTLQCLPKGE